MSNDLHQLVAPYALDALEPMERARFEVHLEICDDCRSELAGFTETAARLGSSLEQAPPSDLKQRVLVQAAATPQDRPARPVPGRLRRALPRLAVAAALFVGAAGGVGYVVEHDRAVDSQQLTSAMSDVVGAPDADTTTRTYQRGGTVRMVTSESSNAAVVVARNLPRLDSDQVYQLWMIDGSGPTSQGTFGGSGSMIVKDVKDAAAVAITIEPKGGSTSPTTDPIMALDV